MYFYHCLCIQAAVFQQILNEFPFFLFTFLTDHLVPYQLGLAALLHVKAGVAHPRHHHRQYGFQSVGSFEAVIRIMPSENIQLVPEALIDGFQFFYIFRKLLRQL